MRLKAVCAFEIKGIFGLSEAVRRDWDVLKRFEGVGTLSEGVGTVSPATPSDNQDVESSSLWKDCERIGNQQNI